MARRRRRRRTQEPLNVRALVRAAVAAAALALSLVTIAHLVRGDASTGLLRVYAAAVAVDGALIAWWRRQRARRRAAAALQAELDHQIATTDEMSGRAFEQLVARLLVRDGCTDVRVVGGAGDLGADVIAIDQAGHRVVVQCKRYAAARAVGSADVQRFLGTVWALHRADQAVLVTTGRVTRPAAKLAAGQGVTVIDRWQLATWMAAEPARTG